MLVCFVRNFTPNVLAPPVSCVVDEVTPGRFKLYAELLSGEQVLVVDVEPELDPKGAAYMRRKHHRCWPNGVANLKTSLIGELYPSDVIGFLDAPGMVRVYSKDQNDWWFKAVIMLNDPFPATAEAPAETRGDLSLPTGERAEAELLPTTKRAGTDQDYVRLSTAEDQDKAQDSVRLSTAETDLSTAEAKSAPLVHLANEQQTQGDKNECRKRRRRPQPASCMVY